MDDKTQEGLKRAEQYFLEMARGSQEGEDYALAEVCHRAAAKIAELEAQLDAIKELIYMAYQHSDIRLNVEWMKRYKVLELEAANTLLIAENKGWAERFVRIKALSNRWRKGDVTPHNPKECADELDKALEVDDGIL
jgi:hypothetical protein